MKNSLRFLKIIIIAVFIFGICYPLQSQNCTSNSINFRPSNAGQGINWSQFPEFKTPFTVIYGGPEQYFDPYKMLRRGFTHFNVPNSYVNVEKNNRAVIIYNVVSASPDQPWFLERNPWGNNMAIYEKYWESQLNEIRKSTKSQNIILTDIFVLDIERQLKADIDILKLKNSPYTPEEVKKLKDDAFVLTYKKELQDLYDKCASYFKSKGVAVDTKFSSYSDSPVLNTFINIQGKTWNQWKKDDSAINFLNYDFNKLKLGGPFYQKQDIIMPSAYFYYDYPHPFAGEYLSYLMFQIEANRALSDKDNIVFLWQKYSFTPEFVGRNIKPWMAEAMTIFSFFAGAKGIWLWEDTQNANGSQSFANYEYATLGLYRLSAFNDMFEGNYDLIEKTSARDYNENKQAIWRGVKKGNEILVAAHNPWAKSANDEVVVRASYKNWTQDIKLKGYEIHLCKYNLNDDNSFSPLLNLSFFPNPTKSQIQIKADINYTGEATVKVSDMIGRVFKTEKYNLTGTQLNKVLDVSQINSPLVIVSIEANGKVYTEQIVLSE